MPQDTYILKHGAVVNMLDLANCGVRWAKFVDLTNAFAEKREAILDHRSLGIVNLTLTTSNKATN